MTDEVKYDDVEDMDQEEKTTPPPPDLTIYFSNINSTSKQGVLNI